MLFTVNKSVPLWSQEQLPHTHCKLKGPQFLNILNSLHIHKLSGATHMDRWFEEVSKMTVGVDFVRNRVSQD